MQWNGENCFCNDATFIAMRTFFVYILANRSRGLYVGVTNDMARRLEQHRAANGGFSARYRCVRLVFVETAPDARTAIAREKQLKNWRREKKIALIEAMNPAWDDLSESGRVGSADPSTRSARSG
jgi:putative endonuclease